MYMAYGWPQVIPLESSLCPSSQQIIYLKVVNRLLLVVSPTHLELWSSAQHRIRLGKYKRDSDSVQREGENIQAVWSPDTKLIAILTSSFFLHIFKVQFTDRKIHFGGKQPSGLSFATISLVLSEQVPFAARDLTVNIVSDSKHMFIGLSSGSLYSISWKGEFYGAFDIDLQPRDHNEIGLPSLPLDNGLAYKSSPRILKTNHDVRPRSVIIKLDLCLPLRMLLVLYSDGKLVRCSVSKKGLKYTDAIKAEKTFGTVDAVCTSVASNQQILAVGTRRGVVELYDLADSASLFRSVSLHDWGYSVEDTGYVSCIAWTPDNSAFAVGWKLRGLAVWSISGCRLMSTIRQVGLSSVSSPMVKPNQDCKYEPLISGTSLIQWDEYGYKLYAVEERTSERLIAFSFGKCCLNRGVSRTTHIRQVIYGDDRLLIVQSEDSDELKMLNVNLPVSYISQNWPIQHVAASEDGMYLAVSGLHGLILYDIRLKKWRVFGDITQEQKIQCEGLLWLGKIIVVCNYTQSSNMYELLFFPRYHLDQSSLLCRKPLPGKPVVMDVHQEYILVTYRPFDVHIFHLTLLGELTLSSNPELQLSTVRELSIMTAKSHPASMRFIPEQFPKEGISNSHISSSPMLVREPARCLILRANGELSLLDLDDGRERELTDSVELFWVTCGHSEDKTNLIEEVSWLDYGHRGLQVWYPSPGVDSFKQEDFLQLDPELEFDRENFHVLSHHLKPRPYCTAYYGIFYRDKSEEALRLARLSAEKPHFSHCLEWLLFTVFDAEISRQNVNKNQNTAAKYANKLSLLEKTCELIKNFSEYLDVVVSVARKTDARHWGDLFSAAGRSTELFEECFQRRWYRTAACYILVIAKLEGPAVSQYCASRLLQATLDESLYELAGELVRFLLRSGRDYEHASADSDKLSPRFLGYFLFRSSRNQTFDRSSSFKEPSAHVTSVKTILESHASYLMSGKELSKLVAFVKGTQFDLVEYLQRERYGSARLKDFASGLELIGEKLQMGTLQSRLDADFLLAHMCSVKFKEWIVVLATLLRRSEVLSDLFRHDLRLWEAYKSTLQSSFVEYHDLLEDLNEKLMSAEKLEE
ncbi:hypothetical protein IC582_027139 [Cucumis melo]